MAGQQVLRVDRETGDRLESHCEEQVLKAIRALVKLCDIMILSDYGKGFLSPDILRRIIEIGRKVKKIILVDPKGMDFKRYKGVSILTPNLKELGEAAGLNADGNESVIAAANRLIDSCELEAVLVTRSQDGMSLIRSSGKVRHFKAEAKEVFDVSGAGDTAIAFLGGALGAGASLEEASELANIAAGIVVGKIGTAVVHPRELVQAIHHQELSSTEGKVLDLETAVDRVEVWRKQGFKIGFTNGFFELLHPGHLSLLSRAAAICDRLVVALNDDISVKRLKGAEPLLNEAARSAILASLQDVDMVVIFQQDTPVRVLQSLKPDVLIKGANYGPHEVVGADFVRGYGGEIILVEIEDVHYPNSAIRQVIGEVL